ncbi:MAG: hypothetical protein AAGH41_06375 [Pseudomonadota bacterium]
MPAALGATLAAVAVLGNAVASEATAPTQRTLDVSMCGVFFFVDVSVTGSENEAGEPLAEPDEKRILSFVYDTGASNTFVDPDALFEATGSRVKEGKRVNIQGARSGDARFTNFRARTRDLDHLSVALGRDVEGILAHDAFSGWVAEMDYQEGSITITQGALPSADERAVFSTKGPDERPWLAVNFEGRERRILIDTGSTGHFALNKLERFDLESAPVTVGYAVRINRLEKRRGARLAGTARFGGFAIPSPQLSEAPKTELFGGQVLRDFRLRYDANNRRMGFETYSDEPIGIAPPITSTGLIWAPEDGNLSVKGILPGFEDAVGDIEVGDVVTAMNGKPLAERGCSDPRQPVGATTLTVKRDGQTLQRVVEPTTLIP